MRGMLAKRIRRWIFGDLSLKSPRKYLRHQKTGQVINDPDSPRAKYLRAKRTLRAPR